MSFFTKEKVNSETEENINDTQDEDDKKLLCYSNKDSICSDNLNRPTVNSIDTNNSVMFSWTSKESFDLRIKTENLYKINSLFAVVFLFRSMVDIGLFATPYSFGKVGYLLGITICILTAYCSGYGIYIITTLTNDVEDELFMANDRKKKIHTFYDLAMRCSGNAKYVFRGVLIILISMLNISILIGNMANTANFLYEVKGIEQWKCKLGFTFVFMIIMAFTVDSSRISFLSLPSTIFL